MSLKRLILLYVEDYDVQARMLQRMLLSDAEIDVASTLSDAISKVKARSYDAILFDLGLPDSNGLDGVVRLRAVTTAPILIFSARDGTKEAVLALRAGADNWLEKGASGPQILTSIYLEISRRHADHALLTARNV